MRLEIWLYLYKSTVSPGRYKKSAGVGLSYGISILRWRPAIMISTYWRASQEVVTRADSVGWGIISSTEDIIWGNSPKTIAYVRINSGTRVPFIAFKIMESKRNILIWGCKSLSYTKYVEDGGSAIRRRVCCETQISVIHLSWIDCQSKQLMVTEFRAMVGENVVWGGRYISKTRIPWIKIK